MPRKGHGQPACRDEIPRRLETLIQDVTLRQNGSTPHHTGSKDHLAAASPGAGLDALALANLHGGLVVDGGCSHALLDLSCHCQECLLDVRRVLGGGLEERNAQAVCEFLQEKKKKESQHRRSTFPHL